MLIKAPSVFGGIKLILPNNVNVKISNIPLFGGVSNKYYKKQVVADPNQVTYTIYLNSVCMFGGIEIL